MEAAKPEHQETFIQAKHQLIGRGCTENEATRALFLLLQMEVPPAHLERWVSDLWSLVQVALEGDLDE